MTWTRLALVLMLLTSIVAAPVAAQQDSNETPELYENHTDQVDNESWMSGHENATLGNAIHFASRVGTFVIGGEPGSTDAATTSLVLGMVLMGAMIGLTAGVGVGMVGGGVLAVISLFGVVAVDLAPEWFFAVAIFLVGVLLSSIAKRQLR